MQKKLIIASIVVASALTTSAVFAQNGHFKTGDVSLAQAKQMCGHRAAATPSNQLFVCNDTNLPNQTGKKIKVSFPQAGVSDQTPAPGQCAYLTNANGSFSTQVIIYTPANSGTVDFNNNMSSGQMWGVTYNAQNGSYPVAQIQ